MIKYYGKQRVYQKGRLTLKNNDILKKYLAYDEKVRVFVVDATNMVKDARKIHNLSNVATAALGRTMMVTTMMSNMLKEKEHKITVQIKGNGPLKSMVVCGDNSLKMKGYVTNPNIELLLNEKNKLDVKGAIGQGYLNVIKDIGLKEPYVGFSELVSGEIAEDFAYYFVTSEQAPCAVSLGVNISKSNEVEKAFGYIIEPLPNCDESIIETLESINSNIYSITNLAIDLQDIDDIAKTITGDNNLKCIEEKEPKFECDCDKKRIERTIIAIGKKDAIDTAKNNNNVLEICCNFCNKVYKYDIEMINNLFDR